MFSLIASGLLVFSTTAAYAQWQTIERVDEYFRPTGEFLAVSPASQPFLKPEPPFSDIGVSIGVRKVTFAELYVGQCRPFFVFNMKPDLKGWLEDLIPGWRSPSDEPELHSIDILMNDVEHGIAVSNLDIYGDSTFLVVGKEDGFTSQALAQAKSMRAIIPLQEGNYVVEFDMTGSKEAISKACDL